MADYEQKQKQFFAKLLSEPSNNLCADCGSKSPRWASWNLGSFICIRCSGIHRKLGVHITKVKSVTLDKWTDEQLQSMANGGNLKVNQLYNPSNIQLDLAAMASGTEADRKLEQFIRDKYEFKKFMTGPSQQRQQQQNMNFKQQSAQQGSGLYSATYPYNNELKQLTSMGFEEALVREALQNSRGSVPSAVEYIVQHRKPSISNQTQPAATSINASHEYFKDAPRVLSKELSATGQVLHQGTSPLLKQLHNMGFTDDKLNMAAINQANGSLEMAVEILAEGKVNTSRQPAQQQQQKPPKQDLLGLFDTQDQSDFGDFQGTSKSQAPPSNVSANTSKKMNTNDILGLFDSSPAQTYPQQQFGQFQQSPPQQQFQQSPPQQQFQQSPPQQQFQQSPPQQQYGQFQQSPFQQQPVQSQQRVISPTSSEPNPFAVQQQFGQFQQSPPQQQFHQANHSNPFLQSSPQASSYIVQVIQINSAHTAAIQQSICRSKTAGANADWRISETIKSICRR
eukprot:NODE_656_length_5493_cov_0.311828.p1 type:complete len:509 gc:universal NODE_656_length_5493_cov_0.311828:1762-236(-)